jgi:hypothetical protein
MNNLTLWLLLAFLSLCEGSGAGRGSQLSVRKGRTRPRLISPPLRPSPRQSDSLYAYLRGEETAENDIQWFLSTTGHFPFDSELFLILKEYMQWNNFSVFDMLSKRISFEDHFQDLLELIDEAAKLADRRYFSSLIHNQARLIHKNSNIFWDFLIETKGGSCDADSLMAAECLYRALANNESIKNECSFYLLNGLFKYPETANRVNLLLNSLHIDPDCTVSPCFDSSIRLPFVYSLLNCDGQARPSHYYSCFFNCPRVDINCVIPAFALLGHDPEKLDEVQVCALPLLYHSLILINFEAFFQLAINSRLNGRLVLQYLPRFIFWILSKIVLKFRR